jgi:hypothetical protein
MRPIPVEYLRKHITLAALPATIAYIQAWRAVGRFNFGR